MPPDVHARAVAGVALEQAGRPTDGRKVSVVICTRDRAEELSRCLASLPRQSRVPDQVVVVDNASRDDGRTRAAALAAGVDYVREDRPGLDIARNWGVRAATGDIVAFTDDDVRLHPRWLERLTAAFDADGVMAVTGLVLPAELETAAQLHFETYWGFGRGYRPIDFGAEFFRTDRTHGCPAWEIGAGANMAFRRETFRRAGLFDERLDVGAAGCSGDSEYWHRVLFHGGICRYEPAAVAFHYHRREFAGLSRQIFAYMRGHAAALLVQYERSGNLGKPAPRPGDLARSVCPALATAGVPRPRGERPAAGRGNPRLRLGLAVLPARPRARIRHSLTKTHERSRRRGRPTVSAIIPARNAAATLDTALDSLRAQTVPDWEAIVIDDGSTDGTAAVAHAHAARDRACALLARRGRRCVRGSQRRPRRRPRPAPAVPGRRRLGRADPSRAPARTCWRRRLRRPPPTAATAA